MEEEIVEDIQGTKLVTMGVVSTPVELVTKEELLLAFPDKAKTITDTLVTYINMAQTDVQFDVLTMFSQMIEYKDVLARSKGSMLDYVNAIKFCSYLEVCKDNYTQAYIKTFNSRDAVKSRMFCDTKSTEYRELTSMASQYSRTPMVNGIRTVTDAPLQLMVRGTRMKALSMLMEEAASCPTGRDRIAALDAFLKHTAPIADKSTKFEVNVGTGNDSQKRFDSMIEHLSVIGNQQRLLIEQGVSISDVQKLNLKKADTASDEDEEAELC